jgi:hypothetical protein
MKSILKTFNSESVFQTVACSMACWNYSIPLTEQLLNVKSTVITEVNIVIETESLKIL